MLPVDDKMVLCALFNAGRCCPFILEEIAATASLTFEQAWYAVLDLIELRFMTPAGIGLYRLTVEGKETARQLSASG
jgi:hypothetical protein